MLDGHTIFSREEFDYFGRNLKPLAHAAASHKLLWRAVVDAMTGFMILNDRLAN